MIRSNQFVCSFFVYSLLILCTVTVICATPVMRSTRPSHESLRASREKQRSIASKYFADGEKLEWQNPCGGAPDNSDPNVTPPKPTLEREVRALENVKKHIEPALQGIENLIRAEETSDPLSVWTFYEKNYLKFLPTLNNTEALSRSASDASVPLIKRRPQMWHRDIQIFIAAFQYLYKKQVAIDQEINNVSENSKKLYDLMLNAKSLLCEIEILVNNTAHPLRKPFSRVEMGNVLKFEVENPTDTLRYLDRRFTNEMYKQYVSGLLHVVTKRFNRKQRNQKLQESGEPQPSRSTSKQRINQRRNNRLSNESRNRRRGQLNNSSTSNSRNRLLTSNESQKVRGNNSKNRERRPQHNNRKQNKNQNNGHRRQRKITTTMDPRTI